VLTEVGSLPGCEVGSLAISGLDAIGAWGVCGDKRPCSCALGVNLQYKPHSTVSPEARIRVAETLAAVLSERLRLFGGKVLSTLAPTTFVLVSLFAVAQNPACPPNTATYPCVYVANQRGDNISVINANTNKVIGTITAVGKLPLLVAVTPDNATLYIAKQSQFSVMAIDTASGNVIANILLSGPPLQIAATPDGGFVYVTEDISNGVYLLERIATNTNTVDTTNFPSQSKLDAIAFSPDGKTAYAAVECPNNACVDILDTSTLTAFTGSPFSIQNTIPSGAASIAVTPDGLKACMSVQLIDGNLGVAFVGTASNPPLISTLDLGNSAVVSDYGFGIAPDGVLYAAEPGVQTAPQSTVISINTSSQALLNTIQVGLGPTGVAVGPGGASVYVTNAYDNTVSIIDTLTNTVITLGSGNGFSFPQGVAAMSAIPPVIATQPANQLILTGQTTTLSVVVTSSALVSYQWYQGLAGDTSAPIAGAAGSSFTTPALNSSTSYWVQVTNIAGAVDSNTATVTVTSNQPPTCTLSVNGAGSETFTNPLTVIATATCVDPQSEALTTTINFGDQSKPKSGANNGVFTASHTYEAYKRLITYPISVTATDASELQSAPAEYSWTLVPTMLAPPVFSGQSSDVTVTLALPSNSTLAQADVRFECTTVAAITSTGSVTFPQASTLGIDCSSNPSTITLTRQPTNFTIVIQTTGGASAQVPGIRRGIRVYAFLVCVPILVLLAVGLSPFRSRHRQVSFGLALNALIVLAFLTVSCGGGFTAPKVQQVTPPGNYQVTVVDVPANGVQPSGFVQTSLIVPLTVSPFQ
jgi:YVTN family beta-propeller protein